MRGFFLDFYPLPLPRYTWLHLQQKGKTMKHLATVLTLLITTALLSACSDTPANTFQGYGEGEYVYISSPIGGALKELHVTRGQNVQQDAPLFTLDQDFEKAAVKKARHELQAAQNNLANLEKGKRPSEIATILARLKQAKASSALAQIEYTRRVKLISEHTISQEELDRAKSDYDQKSQQVHEIASELATARLGARSDEIRAAAAQALQAEAALEQALWNLNQKKQSAPQDGLVFDTLYRAGEWVPAGKPIVSLLPPSNMEVIFFVPEPLVGSLSIGQKTVVTFDGASSPIPAEIYYISPSAEYTPPVIFSSESRAKLVFRIKAKPKIKDAHLLHPGQPVDVTIPALSP
ncbi:HlyD family efflux transporter periplasmic adaptor subunit [uncultured Pseudodesulfovibrio sp.]|uniref:HlyD family secretion protein n=1 Tax=uncultured Pseudodesulfovibrio sp. TaxID=2035858 RepID=UPI0029C7891C|nr:HlyD family efflux transporter periplasmic adaptor subunit [uncultured Pseudodesulfovibrio sp.]